MANKIFLTLLCNFVFVNSQFSNFLNFYSTGGSSRPMLAQYTSYQPIASNRPTAEQYYTNYQPIVDNRETFSQTSSSGCSQYFSYRSDYNGQYGLISIPIPSGVGQIHMKVRLTLAARLSTVRFLCEK